LCWGLLKETPTAQQSADEFFQSVEPLPKTDFGGRKMKEIERAIISVTDKAGVVDFAKSISEFGVQILSTGGTAGALREGGISVTDISEYTGFPEMLDGRVKTLHPKVHGGLLGLRDNPEHIRMMEAHGIESIDLLVVNLYQFEKTVAREGVSLGEAIENIDIGGPAMLRSSAKNFRHVTVIVDPSDYDVVLKEMRELGGGTSLKTRFRLAKKVFQITHKYDGAISQYLEKVEI
jgi:phosphoribosylaminoimidazolecarboxamide formyltransferase/IMP cyclohydrolase